MWKKSLAAVAVTGVMIGNAMAALPTGVTDAVTGAGTDGATLLGALAAAGAAVFLIGKVLRRFGILL